MNEQLAVNNNDNYRHNGFSWTCSYIPGVEEEKRKWL
jgi:hypothetical protein